MWVHSSDRQHNQIGQHFSGPLLIRSPQSWGHFTLEKCKESCGQTRSSTVWSSVGWSKARDRWSGGEVRKVLTAISSAVSFCPAWMGRSLTSSGRWSKRTQMGGKIGGLLVCKWNTTCKSEASPLNRMFSIVLKTGAKLQAEKQSNHLWAYTIKTYSDLLCFGTMLNVCHICKSEQENLSVDTARHALWIVIS